MPLSLRKGRQGVLKRARGAGLCVEQVDQFDCFWPVLEQNLVERHGTKPVHTLGEITYFGGAVPENILLFVCAEGEEVLAGSVLYLSTNVCHVHYNGASAEGRRQGALDLLVAEVIERFSSPHRVIDFGISTELDGRQLNAGLIDYKEASAPEP